MANEKKALFEKSKTGLAIIGGWLGLTGLADGFVEWREWFQVGIINHWMNVKNYILSWVPFVELPSYLVDVFLILLTIMRAIKASSKPFSLYALRTAELPLQIVLAIYLYVHSGWPWWVLALITPFFLLVLFVFGAMELIASMPEFELRLFMFTLLSSLVLFVLTVFVVSDFLYTLGLIQSPFL